VVLGCEARPGAVTDQLLPFARGPQVRDVHAVGREAFQQRRIPLEIHFRDPIVGQRQRASLRVTSESLFM